MLACIEHWFGAGPVLCVSWLLIYFSAMNGHMKEVLLLPQCTDQETEAQNG